MMDLKIAKLLKLNKTKYAMAVPAPSKVLTPYKKCYQIGKRICLVGFYSLNHETNRNLTLAEIEELFKRRKIKSSDVKFDVKHLTVFEEHEYGASKHGFTAFNDNVIPTLIAINRYPQFNDAEESQYSWKFIALHEYFKDNPIPNLEYIDYRYALSVLSENDIIPKGVGRTLSIVVNSYLGGLDAELQ